MMFQSCQKAVLHAAGRAPSSSQLKLSKCSVFGRTSQLMQRPNGAPAREFRPAPVHMGRRSSKIALRKGKADAAKAKLYGKFGKMVRAAVLAGGPDPAGNPRLKDVLHQAKQAGAPNDIIERNLKSKDTKDFTEASDHAGRAAYLLWGAPRPHPLPLSQGSAARRLLTPPLPALRRSHTRRTAPEAPASSWSASQTTSTAPQPTYARP